MLNRLSSVSVKTINIAAAFALVFQAATAQAGDVASAAVEPFKTLWGDVGLPGSRGHQLGVEVDACVVDLWDTSISVTEERFELERMALVDALESDEFGQMLDKLPHKRIAMNLAFFDDVAKPITEGWVAVDSKSRLALAQKIRNTPRLGSGYTLTNVALHFALKQHETCQSPNPAIDIVTDGKTNFRACVTYYNCKAAEPIADQARDEVAARGIRVNVLAIQIDKEPKLKKWAQEHLATQPYYMQEERGLHRAFGKQAPEGKVFGIDGMNYEDKEKWKTVFARARMEKIAHEIAMGPRTTMYARMGWGWDVPRNP